MDDRDQDEPDDEALGEPVTERVRIIGAQPAGAAAGLDPSADETVVAEVRPGTGPAPGPAEEAPRLPLGPAEEAVGPLRAEEAGRSTPSGRNGGDPLEAGVPPVGTVEAATVPDMPHWTEAPTGQVPAVLDRRGDEDEEPWSAAGDTGPAWREHQHEWEDSSFDPSLLADDETRVGALEETPVEERRPWEFDDLGRGRAPAEGGEDGPSPDGDWWDEDDEAPPRPAPVLRTATPAVATTAATITPRLPAGQEPEPESGEPGVASISSSPLRVGTRDRTPATAAGRGGLLHTGVRPPGPGGQGSGRDVPVAIATGLGVALLAVLCFELGSVATLVLATVVVVMATAECYAALRKSGRRPATFLGLVGTVGIMVAAYTKGVSAIALVGVLVVVASMVWYLVGAERGSAVEGVSSTLFGFAWVGLLGSFAALMLAPSQYPHRHGVAFLLGAVVAAVGADVGALAIGSWLGRHPLAPRVSPRKTWQGLIGGAVVAIALSAAVTGQVHPWTVQKAALLGVVAAVLAPLGDLCESLVKRDLGLKDMGSILPGHGGVLDRVDALLFVLPATYYLVRVLNLG